MKIHYWYKNLLDILVREKKRNTQQYLMVIDY